MQQTNLYQQYKIQSLETMTREEVVVKLFEEASKQIGMGVFYETHENTFKSFNCLAKAQKIMQSLNFSLDMKYAVSLELSEMYLFIHAKLGEAGAKKDVSLMKAILSLVDELKVTFQQAEKLARTQKKIV
ncbi:MAG: flagellar protein FliS [Eubacteriales bacterium]|nr:flagellar protein FliS [Eubacteriales bacterium]